MKSNVTAKSQWTSALLSALLVGPASAGIGHPDAVDYTQTANADEGPTFSSGLTRHSVVDAAESTDGHVLTLDNGQQITLSADDYAAWSATSDGRRVTEEIAAGGVSTQSEPEKYGDCGMSFIYVDGIGDRRISITTGYNVTRSVIASGWWVGIYDNGGASEQSFGGGAPNNGYWASNKAFPGMTPGYAWAEVTGGSFVILWTGSICTSLSPWDDANIY